MEAKPRVMLKEEDWEKVLLRIDKLERALKQIVDEAYPKEAWFVDIAKEALKQDQKNNDPNSPGEGFRRGGYLGDAID